MSNLFSNLTIYAGKWNVKAEMTLDAEDKAMFSSAKVVSSTYGKSVCFFLKAGGKNFIPMSTEGVQLAVGEEVNLDKCSIQILWKQGEADIYRVKVNA